MSEIHVLRGMLYEASNGEADGLLGIHLDGTRGESAFVAEWAAEVIGKGRAQVTVRYFTSSEPMEVETMIEELVKSVVGAGEAEYDVAYSEITGYLWTDESFVVGGHDMIRELGSHVASFLHLEVEVHAEAAV